MPYTKEQALAYNRKWRAENKEKTRVIGRKASAKHYRAHKEKCKEASKQYRNAHIEQCRERESNYLKEHPEINRKNALKYYYAHPEKVREYTFSKRGKGYLPINSHKRGYSAHHLFLGSNSAFCVYIPDFIHSFYKHNSKTGEGMDTINAVALSIFVDGDEQFL